MTTGTRNTNRSVPGSADVDGIEIDENKHGVTSTPRWHVNKLMPFSIMQDYKLTAQAVAPKSF